LIAWLTLFAAIAGLALNAIVAYAILFRKEANYGRADTEPEPKRPMLLRDRRAIHDPILRACRDSDSAGDAATFGRSEFFANLEAGHIALFSEAGHIADLDAKAADAEANGDAEEGRAGVWICAVCRGEHEPRKHAAELAADLRFRTGLRRGDIHDA
jgi:hypothetical protein